MKRFGYRWHSRGSMQITKREVLVSIAIILLMIGCGFLISSKISDSVSESNERYNKALKIEDMTMYDYAKETGVGYAFTTCSVSADTPQSLPELVGNYLYIERIYEVETLKTRTVTKTHTDSKGNTYTTQEIETYWEWDEDRKDYFTSDTITFNGDHYSYNKFNNYPRKRLSINNDTIETSYKKWYQFSSNYLYLSSHKRYYYYVVPTEFTGSAYLNFQNGDISGKVNLSTISSATGLYNSYLSSPVVGLVIFWISWTILTGIIVFAFYYIDNRWLED